MTNESRGMAPMEQARPLALGDLEVGTRMLKAGGELPTIGPRFAR